MVWANIFGRGITVGPRDLLPIFTNQTMAVVIIFSFVKLEFVDNHRDLIVSIFLL
jgi:hypothetical protein